jgi:hypothetical protein
MWGRRCLTIDQLGAPLCAYMGSANEVCKALPFSVCRWIPVATLLLQHGFSQ